VTTELHTTWPLLFDRRGFYLAVFGKSMLPSLFPGDRLWIERVDPSTLRVGEIVMVRFGSRARVHRIQGIRRNPDGKSIFIARGDAMPEPDPEVSEDDLVGKVMSVLREGREISPDAQRSPWNRATGSMLAHCGPLATVASRLLDEKIAWKKRRGAHRTVGPQPSLRRTEKF